MQIPFANQSFGVFVGQLKDKFMNQKHVRHVFSKKERQVIYEKSNQTCLCCGKEIKIKETHIDHIIPLANGGTNDEENLQLLCKPCHFEKTKHEAEQGYVKLSETASSFNKTTLDIFNSPLCASRAFVEHVKDINTLPLCQRQNKVFHFDINKCRKNCLRYNNFDFPLFTVMDQPKDFTKTDELKPGLYFVESDMYFPLRGNGWYSQPMIEFCLSEGYITKEQIKYSIEASLTIPSNYFNDFIDYCYTELGEFAKLSINSMIGCFKPKERENWRSMLISKDPNECFYHYLHNDGCFVESREIDDETYYIVYNKYFTNKDETEAPIYNMILDMEAIQLKKLATRIESNKGTIIDLSTDCVSAVFPTNNQPFKTDGVNLKDFFFDDKNVVHAYKLEEKESMLKHEQLPRYTRVDHVELQPVIWNVIPDATDNDFTPLVDQILDSKLSCNLDGAAGTGKSTLLKQLMAKMDQKQLNYVALAPTNKAANIIKGITIHRFAISCSKKNIKQMKLDYILVDEVSMLQEMFYKFLCSVSRAFPNIRFILAGDFNQLEPVNDRVVNCDYKNSIALHELAGGNRVQLSKCRRSDDTLFNLIKPENIPTIDKSKFGSRFTERHIVFTNKRRIEINKNMMESQYQIKKTKAKKEPNCLNLPALDYDPNSQDVKLIVGTPIIARKNCVQMEIANNETFDIKAIKHKIKIVTISDGSRELDIKFDDFKKLFNPAYAITCHKSQGTTFNHAYTVHEWNKMSTRMKYVALSRSTDLAHINILTA
jgi:5-methylcytosine-specific restriction protein A